MAITTEQRNQLLQDMLAGKMTTQDVVSIGSGYVPYGSTPPSQLTSTLVALNDPRKIYDYALQNSLTAYQVEQALNMPIGGANQWAAGQGLAPIANTAEANKNVNFYANPTTWMGEATPNQNVPVQAQQQQSTSATPSMSNTDFNVNELKTAAIADSNNPIVRQAMARAMQSMNGRGLLNSSMATQAAQEAAIAKALEIAAPDTAAYYTDQRDAKQFDYSKQLTKLQGEINFQNSAGLARLNNDLGIANAQAQYNMKVGDVTQTNYITMIDRIQQDTTKQVQQINSSAMPYEEKQAAIRNIQAQAQAQIDNANRLFKSTNGWQDQWAVAADTYSWQVEGAPEKPEDDNPFNNSGEY